MKNLLLIGLGGFVGSILRYLVGLWSSNWFSNFPIGTLTVNLIGSLIIGFLIGVSIKPGNDNHSLLVIGFCGGFTTFSAFALDNVNLIKQGLWSPAIGYSVLSVVGALLLCLLGIWVGNKLV